MICPFCRDSDSKVIDSRPSAESIRRRRECLGCGKRFTTYEKVESAPLKVVKRDGSREPFSREKLRAGVVTACNKRPVTGAQIDTLIAEVEADLLEEYERGDVPSWFIGGQALERLRELDELAAARYASVLYTYGPQSKLEGTLEELEVMRVSR